MDKETVSVDNRIKALSDKLDGLIGDKKLNFHANDSEIDQIFQMSAEDLFRLPHQKMAEYAYTINRYGVYLQKELNKQRGLLNWARKSIDYIVLPKMKEYRQGYMTSDEVKMSVIRDNDVATKIWAFMVDKENEVSIISDMNIDIRKMADNLSDAAKTKRYNNG